MGKTRIVVATILLVLLLSTCTAQAQPSAGIYVDVYGPKSGVMVGDIVDVSIFSYQLDTYDFRAILDWDENELELVDVFAMENEVELVDVFGMLETPDDSSTWVMVVDEDRSAEGQEVVQMCVLRMKVLDPKGTSGTWAEIECTNVTYRDYTPSDPVGSPTYHDPPTYNGAIYIPATRFPMFLCWFW